MTLNLNKSFNNINDYYNHIEVHTVILKDHAIPVYISQLLDKTEDDIVKTKLVNEIYFSDFNFEQEKLTIDVFGLDYLKERAQAVRNNVLKAKYNHMLWLQTKNMNFAKEAVDSYLEYLKASNFKRDDNLSNQAFGENYKLLLELAQNVKYKKLEVIDYALSLFEKEKINGYQEYALFRVIVEKGKSIGNDKLRLIYDHVNKIIDDEYYPEFLEYYLKLQVVLSQKINENIGVYHEKLGNYYVNKAEEHDSFIVHNFLMKAMEHYMKAGNKTKTEEVTVLLQKAKSNLKFGEVKIDNSDLNKNFNDYLEGMKVRIIEFVNGSTAKEIFECITYSNDIFPKAELFKNEIRPITFDLISVTVFDSNKNISSKTGGIKAYDIHINNFSQNILMWIFAEGIKSKKLSFATLSEYMLEYTWYGEDIIEIGSNGQPTTFKWFELLSASLQHFFNQMEKDIELDKVDNIEYQLSIDSLAIKFEGLLRTFSNRIEAQTIDYKDNETQERISFEKLLDNEKFIKFVPADDIALFKFLFTSEGRNFRNNIAHSFYRPRNYSVAIMWFLISAILKLGVYGSRPIREEV